MSCHLSLSLYLPYLGCLASRNKSYMYIHTAQCCVPFPYLGFLKSHMKPLGVKVSNCWGSGADSCLLWKEKNGAHVCTRNYTLYHGPLKSDPTAAFCEPPSINCSPQSPYLHSDLPFVCVYMYMYVCACTFMAHTVGGCTELGIFACGNTTCVPFFFLFINSCQLQMVWVVWWWCSVVPVMRFATN